MPELLLPQAGQLISPSMLTSFVLCRLHLRIPRCRAFQYGSAGAQLIDFAMDLRRLQLDAYHCHGPLNDPAQLAKVMKQGIRACGATLRHQVIEQFTPHGVTVVAILAESHCVLSTWPELDFATIDVAVCGEADIELLTAPITALLEPTRVSDHRSISAVKAGLMVT